MELVFNPPWDGLKAAFLPPFGMPKPLQDSPRFRPSSKWAALRCGGRMRGGVENGRGIYRHIEGLGEVAGWLEISWDKVPCGMS